MNFFDCLPEYCMTKKVVPNNTSSNRIILSENIPISHYNYTKICSFMSVLSGAVDLSFVIAEAAYSYLQIKDNGVVVSETRYYENIALEDFVIESGHTYEFSIMQDTGSEGKASVRSASIYCEVVDNTSMFFNFSV